MPKFQIESKSYYFDDLEAEKTHDSVLALDLISSLVVQDADRRLSATEVLRHPYFWKYRKILDFITTVSNRVTGRDNNDRPKREMKQKIEEKSRETTKGDFTSLIDPAISKDLNGSRNQSYDGKSVRQLLRAIRNKVI